MKVFKFIPTIKKNTAVAIGIFDGLHMGHKQVILSAVNSGYMPVVFTIDVTSYLPVSKKNFYFLNSQKIKFKLIEQLGVKITISPRFEDIKDLSFLYFFKHILIEKLNTKFIVCGKNFKFGKDRSADVFKLKFLANKYKIHLKVLELLKYKDEVISSSRARLALKKADLKLFKELLGYYFYIEFKSYVHINFYGNALFIKKFCKDVAMPKEGLYIAAIYINKVLYYGRAFILKEGEKYILKVIVKAFLKKDVKYKILVKFLKHLGDII